MKLFPELCSIDNFQLCDSAKWFFFGGEEGLGEGVRQGLNANHTQQTSVCAT